MTINNHYGTVMNRQEIKNIIKKIPRCIIDRLIKNRNKEKEQNMKYDSRATDEHGRLTPEKAQSLVRRYGTQREAAENTPWSIYQISRAIKRGEADRPLTESEIERIRTWILTRPHESDGKIAHDMNGRFRASHIAQVRQNFISEEDNDGCIEYENSEELEECERLAAKNQKLQDKQRVERKSWRENTRVVNAVEEYSREIRDLLKKHSLDVYVQEHESDEDAPSGIIHFTDSHFNELIEEVMGNSYDFPKAGRRMKKLARRTAAYFIPQGITDVALCVTGDLLNSDRRMDELMAQATNRSQATFLAVNLMKQFIEELNRNFNVTVASVSGNESRIGKEIGYKEDLVTDNYDFTIMNILKLVFMEKDDCKGVEFLEGGATEKVLQVNGKNFLLTHGYNIGDNCERTIAEMKARYLESDIRIDYVLFGHLHSARIADMFGRGSSLCGSNEYSEKGLNLSSRASQNIYVVHDDGNLDGIKVDLQNADDEPGYDIDSSLEAYNAKSADKCRDRKTVMHIVT